MEDPTLLAESQFDQYEWFQRGYNHFETQNLDSLSRFKTRFKIIEILAFVGNWCKDTQEQLPKLIRILDEIGVSRSQIHFLNLDRTKTLFGWTDRYQIERVPTFIFLEAEKEIGRIVEAPQKSFIEDLIEVLSR